MRMPQAEEVLPPASSDAAIAPPPFYAKKLQKLWHFGLSLARPGEGGSLAALAFISPLSTSEKKEKDTLYSASGVNIYTEQMGQEIGREKTESRRVKPWGRPNITEDIIVHTGKEG